MVEQSGLLRRAAILHDIGYVPAIAETGFHALDGARYLRSVGVDPRVVNLVAHHSCALIEAEERGLAVALAEFPIDLCHLADALIFCDLTVSPDGERVGVDARIAEVLDR
jgi:predicted hydrolase (HD superfamily)